MKQLQRLSRGMHSAVAGLAFPLGGWWLGSIQRLCVPARLTHGLAVVLPGVEGRGPLNWSIARGLDDGGFPGAILVFVAEEVAPLFCTAAPMVSSGS